MGKQDISRVAFDSKKHYATVRMQQGRVIVDDDWNENERIRIEDQRRGRVDVIGPAGSPDDGFRISNAQVNNDQPEFDIEVGTFYVGGHRLEMETKRTYRTQLDFLRARTLNHAKPADGSTDLVYLEAFLEPVSAAEDEELYEKALGGPDTSTRGRITGRVRLHRLAKDSESCSVAWQELLDKMKGNFTNENELRPIVKLKVTYGAGGDPDDLCKPHAKAGYLGAENQAIRVQFVDEDHLTWGFDNASSLYRVEIDANRKKVTLLTEPKDEAHWPLVDQIVEILPWSAELPNKEKVAAMRGYLTSVAKSYNAKDQTLELKAAIPNPVIKEWLDRAGAANLAAPGLYFFLRVWNRGSDTSSAAKIPFVEGTALALGNTGLEVTIDGPNRWPGDYWIIAARPETPDQVIPWSLEDGRSPHGVRRFYAPLALIHWKSTAGGGIAAEIHDCRPTFRPLTRLKTCCTFTVGDGKVSHGDFDSIEAALKHLPKGGGQICVLPGTHRANVVLKSVRNIKITGCERRTRILPRAGKAAQPLFKIADSQLITLEHMDLVALGGKAIVMEGATDGSLQRVEIGHNRVLAYKNAIVVERGTEISIHHNRIRMLDKSGAGVAIYMHADDSLIEHNDIGVVPAKAKPPTPPPPSAPSDDPHDPCADPEELNENLAFLLFFLAFLWNYVMAKIPTDPYQALGGIQIAGGSDGVRVLENNIHGGAGNGITLGGGLDLLGIFQPESEVEETEPEFLIRSDGALRGFALSTADKPLQRVTMTFRRTSDGLMRTTMTRAGGAFNVEAPAGDYEVAAAGYKVDSVEIAGPQAYAWGRFEFNAVRLVEVQEPEFTLPDVNAFLYGLQIEGNTITDMGMSGIGVPGISAELIKRLVAAAKALPSANILLAIINMIATLGAYAIDLSIMNNHIRRCLQNALDLEMQETVKRRGLGGISLALCENAIVRGNRIEDNGRNHTHPVCGIFVSFADRVDVSYNEILNNGPLDFATNAKLVPGIRGGVVVALATCYPLFEQLARVVAAGNKMSTPDFIAAIGGERSNPVKGRQAARIHDNVVEQPVGHALYLRAHGPISIGCNQFSTDFASEFMFAGAVEILNVGSWLGEWRGNASQAVLGLLNGNCMFYNNQTCLGYAGTKAFSQAIVTADDLGYQGNQSDVLAEQILVSNTWLWAATVRAADSRFKEPLRPREIEMKQPEMLSLLSMGSRMSCTTNNQGNHCIVGLCVDTSKEVNDGNRALFWTIDLCKRLRQQLGDLVLGRLKAQLK